MDEGGVSLNRLQRWMLGHSAARYARLTPEQRQIAIERDRYLLSARALGLWVGIVCGIVGTTYGLSVQSEQVPVGFALLFALVVFAGLLIASMDAWLRPERFSGKRMWRIGWLALVATYAGAIASFRGDLRPLLAAGAPLYEAALRVVWRATSLQIMLLIAWLMLLSIVATARRQYMQSALEQARAAQERDTAARQLAQARLWLLQAQIQPHFLVNTLAALQHWVDVGDARAALLLRDLTSFLRASTEAMLRPEVTLAEECAMVER